MLSVDQLTSFQLTRPWSNAFKTLKDKHRFVEQFFRIPD